MGNSRELPFGADRAEHLVDIWQRFLFEQALHRAGLQRADGPWRTFFTRLESSETFLRGKVPSIRRRWVMNAVLPCRRNEHTSAMSYPRMARTSSGRLPEHPYGWHLIGAQRCNGGLGHCHHADRLAYGIENLGMVH
jgi:hypothetical protein